MKIICDVWIGESHMDHVARFFATSSTDPRIDTELRLGALVNLRADDSPEFGPNEEFDERKATIQ